VSSGFNWCQTKLKNALSTKPSYSQSIKLSFKVKPNADVIVKERNVTKIANLELDLSSIAGTNTFKQSNHDMKISASCILKNIKRSSGEPVQ
jgi:hypothetical protein